MSPAVGTYEFAKGHGTENDFVLLPDLDATVHGELSADRVRALCDRRAGIGADGVLRVVRTTAYDGGTGIDADVGSGGAEFFMDYRNADGSVGEMCGNGLRVFVRWLVEAELVDPTGPVSVGTRNGIKVVTIDGDLLTADMGVPQVLGDTEVSAAGQTWTAHHVDMGNPHAVVLLDDLAQVGPLLEPPGHDASVYPDGVNVEFVVRRGERHVAMRVHERGSGETRSCGTGACAVMIAAVLADGAPPPSEDLTYRVDVPGGTLAVTWTARDRVLLTGPAVVVARGDTDL